MGVITWTDGDRTAYVNISSPVTQLLSSDAELAIPDIQMKADSRFFSSSYTYRYQLNRVDVYKDGTKLSQYIKSNESVTPVAKNIYCALTGWESKPTLRISEIFTPSNSTVRTIPYYLKTSDYTNLNARYTQDGGGGSIIYADNVYPSPLTLATINVTLDAPPTFTKSSISYDTNYVYAGLTRASITISNADAKYGGSITSSSFTIGNQTVTGNGNGTLSIDLDSVGTFTPIVTVTDSRGQTTPKECPKITVNGYTTPKANNVSVERTDDQGISEDEGQCAIIEADISWTSVIANLTSPTIEVKDLNGNTLTSTTTWYTSRDDIPNSAINDWSQITSADMPVYGLIDNSSHNLFNTQYSYTISITPNDDIPNSGITVPITLGSAFYTVDFLAGGHGIAFGRPCSEPGFYVDMDTTLLQGVEVIGDADISGDMTVDGTIESLDTYIDIPDYSSSGTDKAIYDALVSLGWKNDVAPNDTQMSVKEFLAKLISIANSPRIVEQGTSSIWTYRKWSDGTAECWGTYSWTISSWSGWGSTYYTNYSGVINYPSGLFKDTPTVTADGDVSSGDTWLASRGGATYGSTKDHTASYYFMRASSGSTGITGYVNIYAIGKWK